MSVDFEPVKLDPRRRRIDPVVIGAIVVVVALATAVLKPWEPHEAAAPAAPSPIAARASGLPGASGRPPVPAASPSASLAPGFLAMPTWAEVGPAVAEREEWGIWTIVVDQTARVIGVTSYSERWFPLSRSPGSETTFGDDLDRAIVALGITFPPSDAPLDARIWRVHDDGRLEWVDAHAIDPVPSRGAFLFVRPGTADAAVRAWGAGHYRIDVLVDGAVRRFSFEIPAAGGPVAQSDPWPIPEPGLVEASAADPSGIQIGMFATVDGYGVPLAAAAGDALDATGAWLDVDPGTRQAPRSHVARAYLPRATGLGVMLAPGSTVRSAWLQRLAPDDPFDPPSLGGGLSNIHSRQPYVVFAAPDGGAWTPGVYAITVTWADGAVSHTETWHAELRPGPLPETPRLLAAVRAWARFAGASGFVLGSAEPVEGLPLAEAIRLIPARADDLLSPPVDDRGCGRTRVPFYPGAVGFASRADAPPARVSAAVIDPDGRLVDQPLLSVGPTIPGLAVVAPANAPAFGTGTYKFALGDGPIVQRLTICLGAGSSGG